MAGVLGIDPNPLTLRELSWRYHARQQDEWARASSICAMLANTAPGKKGRRFVRLDHFSPYRSDNEKITFKEALSQLAGKKLVKRRRKKREAKG